MKPRILNGRHRRRVHRWWMVTAALAGPMLLPAHADDLAGTITTIAGEGKAGFSGDGGPALAARLRTPMGLTLDARGNLYVADQFNHRIRKIDPAGTITTVAGTGKPGFSGDGGPAVEARLNMPGDVEADRYGNLYIADWGNNRVRKIDTRGVITTVAGNGRAIVSGDGGPATQAGMTTPRSLAIDAADNLYIADELGGRVRKVTPDGVITTVAGGGRSRKDGILATDATLWPSFVAIDGAGNLWISECEYPARLFRVDPRGILTMVAGKNGDGFAGDGGPVASARIDLPWFFIVDSAGSVFFSDTDNRRVRKIDRDGIITTVAGSGKRGYSGDGGPATAASFYAPTGLVIDREGNLLVADTANYPELTNPSYNRIRKVVGVAAPGLLANRPFPTATPGDLDGDGVVSVRDATLTLRLVMKLLAETASRKAAGDYDGNEAVDVKDVALILRRAIGL